MIEDVFTILSLDPANKEFIEQADRLVLYKERKQLLREWSALEPEDLPRLVVEDREQSNIRLSWSARALRAAARTFLSPPPLSC